jgi:hypothetical protein
MSHSEKEMIMDHIKTSLDKLEDFGYQLCHSDGRFYILKNNNKNYDSPKKYFIYANNHFLAKFYDFNVCKKFIQSLRYDHKKLCIDEGKEIDNSEINKSSKIKIPKSRNELLIELKELNELLESKEKEILELKNTIIDLKDKGSIKTP